MGVFPVRCEEELGASLTDRLGQEPPRVEGMLEAAIGKSQAFAPWDAKYLGGGFGFRLAKFLGPLGRRFPIGQFQDTDAQSLRKHEGDGSTHPNFGIIRMWGDDKGIEHEGPQFLALTTEPAPALFQDLDSLVFVLDR